MQQIRIAILQIIATLPYSESMKHNPFLIHLDRILTRINRDRGWLARRTGISVNTINAWFQKDRYPNLNHAQLVANALGVTIEYLLNGKAFYERHNEVIEEIIRNLKRLGPEEQLQAKAAFEMWFIAHFDEQKRKLIAKRHDYEPLQTDEVDFSHLEP